MKLNTHYSLLKESYLFSMIAKKVEAYKQENPDKNIIRLGIGDVTKPLCPSVIEAMGKANEEMSRENAFKGYGPEQGYSFLREVIQGYYKERQVALALDEIFISDGAKSDLGNILDLFDADNTVLITDPVYPVYTDTNVMAGRPIIYMQANKENGFLPMPQEEVKADLIYLCSPNNPTGALYTRDELKVWVDYALKQEAIILFDAAYEAFITDDSYPHSIYEIEGAKDCAIEFCSLSKTAGFTGTRCGYTIVPHDLKRGGMYLNRMWLRRQTTKFNGVPYMIQRGAEAVFTPSGQKEIKENIAYYQENAKIITEALTEMGIYFTGGEHSPYIWLECPKGMASWEYFDYLLESAGVVGTPGVGFGENGEGFFRLTAFGARENIEEAMRRLKNLK